MKKICKNCKHCYNAPVFCGFYLGEPMWGRRKGGMCSRFPEHIRISDNHFCGEFDLSYEAVATAPIDEL